MADIMADIAPLGFERFPIWESPVPAPRSDTASPVSAPRIAERVEAPAAGPAVMKHRESGNRSEKLQAWPETNSPVGERTMLSGGIEALYPLSVETVRILLEIQEADSHRPESGYVIPRQ